MSWHKRMEQLLLRKPKQYDAIINGVTAKGFPQVPVDYGYR